MKAGLLIAIGTAFIAKGYSNIRSAAMAEQTHWSDEADERAAARTANRFDIRRIIGAVVVLYGVVLAITGIVGSDEVKNKAAGLNVDLSTGLAMLVFGVLMIVWALARPAVPGPRAGRGSGSTRQAPAP